MFLPAREKSKLFLKSPGRELSEYVFLFFGPLKFTRLAIRALSIFVYLVADEANLPMDYEQLNTRPMINWNATGHLFWGKVIYNFRCHNPKADGT